MVGFGFSLFAQSGKLSEDKRKEFEAQKVAFFTQEMDLTPVRPLSSGLYITRCSRKFVSRMIKYEI